MSEGLEEAFGELPIKYEDELFDPRCERDTLEVLYVNRPYSLAHFVSKYVFIKARNDLIFIVFQAGLIMLTTANLPKLPRQPEFLLIKQWN